MDKTLSGPWFFHLYNKRFGPDNLWELSGWFFFLPLWLSDCHIYTWRLLPVVMQSNFKVSELSLLKFTAFIMACPTLFTSWRDQSHIQWLGPRLQNWLCLPLFLPLIFSPGHTQRSQDFAWHEPPKTSLAYSTFSPWAELSWFTVLTLGSWCVLPSCEDRSCSGHSPLCTFISSCSCSLPLPFVQDGGYTTSIPASQQKLKVRWTWGLERVNNISVHSIF